MDKAVVFIVEGATDKKALENIFKKIYRHKEIHFEFTHGDLTSDEDNNIGNVDTKIYEHVDRYRKDKKLNKSDICQIIHIFDTDGTYIDDSYIIEGETKEFFYTTENISCKDVEKVKQRNKHKSELMNHLLTCGDINGIPYQCFYLSSNLDHALYNKLNLDDEAKTAYANAFYEKFLGREKLFIDFLNIEVVNGVPESFPASWRYIKDDLHSLERHTNLNIYFKEHPLF